MRKTPKGRGHTLPIRPTGATVKHLDELAARTGLSHNTLLTWLLINGLIVHGNRGQAE